MGIFNWIKEKYLRSKGIVGTIDSFRKETGYRGKIEEATFEAKIAVNIELQRRIYNGEGKIEKAQNLEKDFSRILQRNSYMWEPEKITVDSTEFKTAAKIYFLSEIKKQLTKQGISKEIYGQNKIKREYEDFVEKCKTKYQNNSSDGMRKVIEKLRTQTKINLETTLGLERSTPLDRKINVPHPRLKRELHLESKLRQRDYLWARQVGYSLAEAA